MTTALLTPLWCRPDIEQIVVEYYAELRSRVSDLELFAAYSEETQDETLDLAHSLGWRLLPCPASPLGTKLNAATAQLRRLTDADRVVFFGSDDLIHIDAMRTLIDSAYIAPAAGYERCYILDVARWCACYVVNAKVRRPCGVGRMLRRDVLDALEWRLRDDDKERGLDASLDARLRGIGVEWHMLEDRGTAAPLVDVKTSTNISSFVHIVKHAEVAWLPPALAIGALGWRWVQRIAGLASGVGERLTLEELG